MLMIPSMIEIIEVEDSFASSGGHASFCPDSSAGESSKLAGWNAIFNPRTSSSHGPAVSTLLYPRSKDEILESVNVKAFTFNELKMATRNFSPQTMLGEGSLGATYKGWIDETTLAPAKEGTGMVVAVKKLNENAYYMDHQEWLAKVKYIAQLSHPRLVKIIGYCLEDEQRLLVYEFMSCGSLDDHLFRSKPMNFGPMLLKFIAYLNKSNIIQKPQNQKKCKKTFWFFGNKLT
jgi:serine/threonine protein kinase